jgi:MFS family permease
MLNRFHVWFPAGIVIGSLLAYFMMDKMDINWQIYAGLLFIPLAIYGIIFLGQKIPETERVASGVTYKGMLMAVGAPVTIIVSMTLMILLATKVINLPEGWMYLALIGIVATLSILEAKLVHKEKAIFPIMFSLMLLTSSTELVTNQWVNALLGGAVESAILLLALISGIMAVGRFFAGQLVHRINPVGVLLMSSIFAAAGIYLLSFVSTSGMTILGAVLFAIGITYFWPTMLGFTSEYIPKTGAMGLSLLGGAGFVSASMFMPVMGKVMETSGTSVALQSVGVLPIIMIVGFAILFVAYRKKKPEVL